MMIIHSYEVMKKRLIWLWDAESRLNLPEYVREIP
jgi:hypothetical protein